MPEREGRGVVSVDGRLFAPEDASVPLLGHGFLYGDGAFETIRAYDGVLFRLEAHVRRLIDGLSLLGIDGAPPAATVVRLVEETLRSASLADAQCRVTVARGTGRGLDPRTCGPPTVAIAVLPLRPRPESSYRDGITATFLWPRCALDMPPPTVKSTSYQRVVLARMELAKRNVDEGFFLDESGNVTEGTTSNVFAVRDRVLITPPPTVCLPGITRAEVLSIAREIGIGIDERVLAKDELCDADEVFVTSSLAELVPIRSVEGRKIGHDCPGALSRELLVRYRERVGASKTVRAG